MKKLELHKKTLNLRKGDFEYLSERFPKKGASVVIRQLVSKFVDDQRKPTDKKQLQELDKDTTL